jgi:small-conductance mechanosensitive channel
MISLFLGRLRLLPLMVVLALAVSGARAAPVGGAAAHAASAAAPGLTPVEAQQLLGVLNDPKKRAAFVATLSNLTKALQPATPGAKAAAAAGLAPDSLGADVLASASELGNAVTRQAGDLQHALHEFRDLGPWLGSIAGDPARRAEVAGALARLAVVLAAALGAVWGINRLLVRPLDAIARVSAGISFNGDAAAEPASTGGDEAEEEVALSRHNRSFRRLVHALARLPFALAHLVLELLPVIGFGLVAFVFETVGFLESGESRVVIATALRCFVIAGILIALLHTLFAAGRPSLRLVLIGDRAAGMVTFWFRLMLLVGAWGFSSITVMQTLGLSVFAAGALGKALMLLEHTLLACLILQSRRDVARRLQPPRRIRGVTRRVLSSLASRWWAYAIFFDYAFWVVWALQIRNGYAHLWTYSFETFLVIMAGRLLAIAMLGGLARGMRPDAVAGAPLPWMRARANRYYPILRRLVTLFVVALGAIAMLEVWGVDALAWFGRGALGGRLFSALVSIGASLAVGVLIWEAVNIALDRHVDRLGRDPIGGMAKVARLRTLLPILRIILSVVLVAIVALTVLSQIGVNIAPLLGGAGILGVAIGFGSQKLVQDFITGIFLLLENTMQVGDWVTAGGLSGSVEHLSIRTIRLRAGDGSVHMIPFSSVTTVTNTNRGLGNAPVSVDIDPREDTDRAADVLKAVALGMRAEPAYKDGMLSDLQFWGVDKVGSQAVTLVGQIACTDTARYGVQREYNRRMRIAFAEAGIRLAMPMQAVSMVRDEELHPFETEASGRIGHEESGTVTDSPPTAALGHGA